MSNGSTREEVSTMTAIGLVFGLLVGELAAALALLGGLWTGLLCVMQASRVSPNDQWKFYLIAGAIFIGIFAICRLRRRP